MTGWLRAIPYLVAALAVASAVYLIRESGVDAEAARRDLKESKATVTQLTTDLAASKLQLKDFEGSVQATAAIAEGYRAQAQRIRTVTKEIIREVPVRIPADACPLPVEWRVLHDAAADGETPDPTTSPGADGGPVAPQDAAETVVENYGQYHDLAERHRALQRYVTEQLK
ncbi:hypothetical protein [Rhizobacter sp. Root1221]|uniref:hypothetical protein n=1 Tax=Rhizobacter sp. Root1221 TaxID=1736433 RepID=UPI0007000E53|nr:hypothetical protein [Rhizobacter sp. Root1221]KQW02225.1 hypothetical protein ASC87_13420 [Rhizobacter sp. Root1221]